MTEQRVSTMTVTYLDGERFSIDVRGHAVTVDQPVDDGGENTAPTPTELFVAGLASCVGFYVHRYLARHGLPAEGLTVTTSYTMATRPARVDAIRLEVVTPTAVPAERREGLLAVASHCTVHNTLQSPPDIAITLAQAAAAGP